MDWLQTITSSLAERTQLNADDLTLTPDERRAILDVARVASHTSGERIYAPLLCYVLGVASQRGLPLDEAVAIVKEQAGDEA